MSQNDPIPSLPSITTIPPHLSQYIQAQIAHQSSNWSFTQGLLLGQLSMILLFIAAVRYLLLEDVDAKKKRSNPTRALPTIAKPTSKSQSTLPPTEHILSKTFYDLVRHAPESVEWLNVLLAQAITQFREDARANGRLIITVDEVLNGGGPIRVTELNLGDEFPIFSNARIRPSDDLGQMVGCFFPKPMSSWQNSIFTPRAEIDFDFNDQLSLGIDTHILVNWPKPRFAALPVSLVLIRIPTSFFFLAHLNTKLTVEFLITPTDRYIAISALPDFELDFAVQSLIGSRTKLEDVPKLADLMTSKLRNVFVDRLVYPNFVRVRVPSLWAGPVGSKSDSEEMMEMVGEGEGEGPVEEEEGGVMGGMKTKVKEKLEEFVEDVKEV
ncbi:hypothetical protein BC937DRAFT_88348 [Endogone sp. FLAS-F59071]|nr:hypothetical protein BC937DRAFT_88348 [Endogone sp. FLAS-F59071]|eukprot:RUS22587.1 hypothetical protein BC937DRAFT_88348 [Endogone sp. FLAS-F59071]